MTDSVTAARPCRSALRAAQAEATRTNVLDAAAGLFVREGYLRTTMTGIAAEAGTSVETVRHPTAPCPAPSPDDRNPS